MGCSQAFLTTQHPLDGNIKAVLKVITANSDDSTKVEMILKVTKVALITGR